jgi:hypothetical protein
MFDPRFTRWRALFIPQRFRRPRGAGVPVGARPLKPFASLKPKLKKPPKQVAQKKFGKSRAAAPAVGRPLHPFRSFGPKPKRAARIAQPRRRWFPPLQFFHDLPHITGVRVETIAGETPFRVTGIRAESVAGETPFRMTGIRILVLVPRIPTARLSSGLKNYAL